MSIQVVWDNTEHTILRYDVKGQWTLQDLTRVREQVSILMSDSHDRLAIIADLRGSQFVPNNLIGHFSRSSYSPLPNVDLVVFVGASRLVQNMVDMFCRVYRRQGQMLHFAPDLENAREQLAANRMVTPVQPSPPSFD